MPQTWHIPSRHLGLKPKPSTLLTINKIKPPKTDGNPKMSSYGIGPKIYCPVPLPDFEKSSQTFTNSLLENLQKTGSKCQMQRVLETNQKYVEYVPTPFGNIPQGCGLSYHILPSPTTDSSSDVPSLPLPSLPLPSQPCSYSTVLPKDMSEVYEGLNLSNDEAQQLEEETRDQSQSKVWHDVRSERITASNFKRVCSRRSDFESLASTLRKQKSIQTKAMSRGIQLEPEAATLYSEVTGNTLFTCGFVVNTNAPHLGCSPDRRVTDLNADPRHGLLEIKCPDKDSYKSCPYLVERDGSYSLKHGHEYHHQITGQMGLTGAEWCDLFIMCRDDYHLERVYFDPALWAGMKNALDKFFFEYFLPTLGK